MVKKHSAMVSLGTQAPDFHLLDVISSKYHSLTSLEPHKATVIAFICNHCPYVKHINESLVTLAKSYIPKGIRFIAINSNDVDAYPADSPEMMKQVAKEYDYPFVYLFDETQQVATAYHAVCTPDFFIYDATLNLIYRGQFDDSRPGNAIAPTGESIKQVLEAVLKESPIPEVQKPSLGCSIKWKAS